jgi:NAD(P)-dependent dehydrogenase (short-subunit alcohol dehydrogenase family)
VSDRFAGAVILVTGGAGGIEAAVARSLALEGAHAPLPIATRAEAIASEIAMSGRQVCSSGRRGRRESVVTPSNVRTRLARSPTASQRPDIAIHPFLERPAAIGIERWR